MIKINDEEMKALKPYESVLRELYDSKRNIPVKQKYKIPLGSIYERICPSHGNVCLSCSTTWIRRLANWYFHTKNITDVNKDITNVNKDITKVNKGRKLPIINIKKDIK